MLLRTYHITPLIELLSTIKLVEGVPEDAKTTIFKTSSSHLPPIFHYHRFKNFLDLEPFKLTKSDSRTPESCSNRSVYLWRTHLNTSLVSPTPFWALLTTSLLPWTTPSISIKSAPMFNRVSSTYSPHSSLHAYTFQNTANLYNSEFQRPFPNSPNYSANTRLPLQSRDQDPQSTHPPPNLNLALSTSNENVLTKFWPSFFLLAWRCIKIVSLPEDPVTWPTNGAKHVTPDPRKYPSSRTSNRQQPFPLRSSLFPSTPQKRSS